MNHEFLGPAVHQVRRVGVTSSKMGHIWNAAAVSMSYSHAPNGAHLPQIDTARSQVLRYTTQVAPSGQKT